MKEWCLLHPWMTFFIINFTIVLVFLKNFTIDKGKKKNMKNLSNKGGINMPDKQNNQSPNTSGNNNQNNNSGGIHRDYGTLRVPATNDPPPPPPPKQD